MSDLVFGLDGIARRDEAFELLVDELQESIGAAWADAFGQRHAVLRHLLTHGPYEGRREVSHPQGDHVEGRADLVPDPDDDFASVTKGNQIAFAAQSSIDLVADILPSFSIRCGYQALYMSSLAMVGDNIDTGDYFSNTAFSQGHAMYHGFQGGLEYIW